MAKFSETWLAELMQRSDIVSLISEYIPLREKGGRLWGLCPFHTEKTPSFSVSADKQLYYCFGCHAGGGAVHFVMELEKLTYPAAIEYLAKRANMAMPAEIDDEELRKAHALREQIYEVLKNSAQFFHEQLMAETGKPAREYLADRGVSVKTLVEFGLGYSPDSWHTLFDLLSSRGFSQSAVLESGVCLKKNDRVYDAYRNRLMFPIIGTYDKVIGFGARTLTNENPKYLNTPETPVFNKRMNLYGLNLQKTRRTDSLIIVEGYMDVVGLRQFGVTNAVASLGTALTPQQARLAKRYCNNVYIAYDGDAAGQAATMRGLDILAAEGLNVKVIVFEHGEDPDEFVRKHGEEAFRALQENALTLNAFKLLRIKSQHDLTAEDSVSDYAIAACNFISTLNAIEQERYYGQLAKETNFSVAVLKKQGDNTKKQEKNSIVKYRNNRTKQNAALPKERLQVEQALLLNAMENEVGHKLLLDNVDLIKLPLHQRIVQKLEGVTPPVQYAKLIADFDKDDADMAAAVIMAQATDDPQGMVAALIQMDTKEKIDILKTEAADDGTPPKRKLECLELIRKLTEELEPERI